MTRLFVDPVAIQLTAWTGGEITGKTAIWIAGVLLVMATILVCGFVARLMKRGASFAGLGWADRVGGGALGLAEGSIVAAVVVLTTLWPVGPDHAVTEDARSVALVEQLQSAHEAESSPQSRHPGSGSRRLGSRLSAPCGLSASPPSWSSSGL